MKRIPLQIVLQGGGAKLCLLMAVCDVLQNHSRVQLTRVAGTSAGAIAAAMLCSKKTIDWYVERIGAINKEYLDQLKRGKIAGLAGVIRGKPYFPRLDLVSFFNGLFKDVPYSSANGQSQAVSLLGHLDPVPLIYYTDLATLAARRCENQELLANALAMSCRLPYALSGYDTDVMAVDGGLALNLPVDEIMLDEATHGRAIGISFEPVLRKDAEKLGLLTYSGLLFSAAIQANVSRSEAILGRQNVFLISTDIDTFDFEAAVTRGLKTDYSLVKAQFATWLDNWLKIYGPQPDPDEENGNGHSRWVQPPLSNIKWSAAIVRELKDRGREQAFTHASSLRLFETAKFDANGKFTGRFRCRTMMTFTIKQPTSPSYSWGSRLWRGFRSA